MLNGFRSTYRTAFAILSLLSFASGSVIGPVLHEAEHAEEAHCTDEAHGHCDHSTHAAAYERPHVSHDSQPCVLCYRHMPGDPDQERLSDAVDVPGADLLDLSRILPDEINRAAYPARGPPVA